MFKLSIELGISPEKQEEIKLKVKEVLAKCCLDEMDKEQALREFIDAYKDNPNELAYVCAAFGYCFAKMVDPE